MGGKSRFVGLTGYDVTMRQRRYDGYIFVCGSRLLCACFSGIIADLFLLDFWWGKRRCR